MKKIAVLISVVLIAIVITVGSCKKDNPVPVEKKKYAWACGSKNTILKTTDGGQHWTRVQAPSTITDANLTSISIVNKTNIWICGSYGTTGNGVVYKSTDGGNTWAMLDSQTSGEKT